jgi:hypothetical protein
VSKVSIVGVQWMHGMNHNGVYESRGLSPFMFSYVQYTTSTCILLIHGIMGSNPMGKDEALVKPFVKGD